MKTTEVNNTEIFEMMQTLMNEGMQGFPTVMARMYNLAMQFERKLHFGAGRYERTDDRRGYANGYKPKTLKTHTGELTLQIPQVRIDGVVVLVATFIVVGILEDGHRSILRAGSLDEAKRLLAATVEKYANCQSKLATWMEENIPE